MKKIKTSMIVIVLLLQIILPVFNVIVENKFTVLSKAANSVSKDGKWEYFIKNNVIHLCGYLGDEKDVEIPQSIDGYQVEYITSFIDNQVIENVKIPSTIKGMGNLMGAFQGCKNLKTVEIEEGKLEDIGIFDFQGCKNLTRIVIPSNIKSISGYAFMGCKNLETINISNGMETIDINAFTDCEKLININIDTNNKNFIYSDNVLYNYDKTQIVFYPLANKNKEYNIPNTVNKIFMYNFENKYLETINIPESVTEIKTNAFSSCETLKQIKVDEENQKYSSDINGVLFNKEKTELIYYPKRKNTNKLYYSRNSNKYKKFCFCWLYDIRKNNNIKYNKKYRR